MDPLDYEDIPPNPEESAEDRLKEHGWDPEQVSAGEWHYQITREEKEVVSGVSI